MTSLLSTILQVADEANRTEFKLMFKDVSKRASLFLDSVKHFTSDVKEILSGRFVDCLPIKSLEYVNYAGRKAKLEKERDELQTVIDKMFENNSSNNKFKTMYDEFTLTANKFQFISDLGCCCSELEVSSRFIERLRYKEASEKLEELSEILSRPNAYNDLEELVECMKDTVSFKHVKCLNKIVEQWRERLKWYEGVTNKGQSVTIEINISDPEHSQDILNALSSSKRINIELMRFADFLVKSAFPALLTKGCVVHVRENLHKIILEIEYKEINMENLDVKSVLKNLITFFETVQLNIDCIWEDNRSVLSILGQIVGKRFFNMLKDNCLHSIVTTEECKVDMYASIANEIDKFNSYLCDIRFTSPRSSPLTEYVKDSHNLICEKKCKVVLEKARTLMKMNFQQGVMEVCANQTPVLCVDEMKMLEKDNHQGRNIVDAPFLLPRCRVSSSAVRLLQLVVEQLDLAHTASPILASRILVTVRNIFQLYYALVPVYHEDVLNSNALDLALFYNNCFYLAHGMLGHPWSKVYRADFAANITMLLADQVQNIRKVAIVKFSLFIRNKRQIIKDIIENSDLNNLSKADSLYLDNDSTIQQCFEMLEKLHRVWQPALPADVYEKTMANLVSCLAEQLVQAIMAVKEGVLSEVVTRSVAYLCKPLLEKIPKLFTENTDLEKLSRKWQRLVEIISLLTSPIFSIASHWKEQDSRLRKNFTSEEMGHLIRTLFPSGKHKSTVLDMIHSA